jgi:hypothetical protein
MEEHLTKIQSILNETHYKTDQRMQSDLEGQIQTPYSPTPSQDGPKRDRASTNASNNML